jgi:tetratricopeptide (TPR) repeat protein
MPNTFSRIGTVAIAVCLAALASAPFAAAQSTAPPASSAPPSSKPKVHTDTTVTVHAGLGPEDAEDSELNQHTFGRPGEPDCQHILDTYPTDLIPRAEKAKFPKNKAKYLELAYSAMGYCQMKQARHVEAEKSFRNAIAHAEIWPGKDDTEYSGLWGMLALAQSKQDRWKDAIASAKHSVASQEAIIDAKVAESTSGPDAQLEDSQIGYARRDRASMLVFLATYYLRDGQIDEALKTEDAAWDEALGGTLSDDDMRQLVAAGSQVASMSGNRDAIAKWAARTASLPAQEPDSDPDSGGAPKN